VVGTHQVEVVKANVKESVMKEGTGHAVTRRPLRECLKQGVKRKLFEDVVAVDHVQSKSLPPFVSYVSLLNFSPMSSIINFHVVFMGKFFFFTFFFFFFSSKCVSMVCKKLVVVGLCGLCYVVFLMLDFLFVLFLALVTSCFGLQI